MERNQFTFYRSFLSAAKNLKKGSDREKFLMALIEYALDGKLPENLPESCNVAFSIVRPILDSSRRKAESASKGGASKAKQTEANGSKPEQREATRKQEKEKEKEKEKDKDKDKEQLEQDCDLLDDLFSDLYSAYPAQRRGYATDAYSVWTDFIQSEADARTALSNLDKWKASEQWTRDGGQYVPNLVNWLYRGLWRSAPEPSGNMYGSGQLGTAEMEALQRMLAEEDV